MDSVPGSGPLRPPRRSIRLTFRVSGSEVELVSRERLEMITPPQVGEPPQAGVHGGYWVELRDGEDRVLAHRLIDPTQLTSVEVHSPDRTIEHVVGAPEQRIVEVLLPDDDAAAAVTLMGEPLTRPKGRRRVAPESRELAHFDLRGRSEQSD
jgi:hypothetical protein